MRYFPGLAGVVLAASGGLAQEASDRWRHNIAVDNRLGAGGALAGAIAARVEIEKVTRVVRDGGIKLE